MAIALVLVACSDDDIRGSGSIEIDTVSGAKHTLSGVYDTGCFDNGGGNSRHDTISVNEIYADYVVRIYTGVIDCSNTADVSTIQVEFSVARSETTTGWSDATSYDPPLAADGLGGTLNINEPITILDYEVLAFTGTQYDGVSVGAKDYTFFVADDGDPTGITLYEAWTNTMLDAKSSNPFIQ